MATFTGGMIAVKAMLFLGIANGVVVGDRFEPNQIPVKQTVACYDGKPKKDSSNELLAVMLGAGQRFYIPQPGIRVFSGAVYCKTPNREALTDPTGRYPLAITLMTKR